MRGVFHRNHAARSAWVTGLALALCAWLVPAAADTSAPPPPSCDSPLATLVVARGDVRHKSPRQDWRDAALNQALCADDEIAVGSGGRAALRLAEGISFPLDQQTRLIVRGRTADGKLQVELLTGNINVVTGADAPIRIVTPHGALETTTADFSVSVNTERAALSVFEGTVALTTPQGSLRLQGDESAYFTEWAAPKRDITLKPRDSVHWILQYPAILPAGVAEPSAWSDAVRAHEAGRSLDALIALDQVRPEARTPEYHVYRAHVLLLGGRPDDAAASVDDALKKNPGLAEAWALRAILDLGRSDVAKAQEHADRAVQLNPASPAAHLARSYAFQANRRPAEALVSARRMAGLAPDSALAFTRIAELELARGERAAAMTAAVRAEQLDPNSAEVKSILGFVRLSEGKDRPARAAFESAVQLNSADSRARMGLGLTRIRQGHLQAGREDLELAASLDPENALLRTYLGRAYEEEGRLQDAAEQYDRARRADPHDPTPYFFDALRLAESNQPLAASQRMREALDRNENRGVYRGEALLAEDASARLANALALDRLDGMEDRVRQEASAAVTNQPDSGVLHRALGDALASLPRADAARRSEYLQAVMDEPLGAPPPPLFLSEGVRRSALAPQHGFFRAAEPGQIGYNEFSAVFGRPPWQAQAGGTLGSHATRGEQFQFSGKYGEVGWALSQLHFRTDGFGEYNRVDNLVMQGIVQADLAPSTRVYAEGLQYNSDRQDISSQAQPYYYEPLSVSEDRWRYRLGVRQRLGERHEVLALGSWENSEQISDTQPTAYNGLTEPYRQRTRIKVRTPEMQYRFLSGAAKVIVGGVSGMARDAQDGSAPVEVHSRSSYAYFYASLPYRLNLELGVALDKQYDTAYLQQSDTNPKLGLRWQIVPNGTLRLASFRATNRALASSATLEPSQVAGFIQDYGDIFGARTEQLGLGWDQKAGAHFNWGVEVVHRELRIPVNSAYDQWGDRVGRAYLNWALPTRSGGGLLPDTEAIASVVYDRASLTRLGSYTGTELLREYAPRHVRFGALLNHGSGFGLNIGLTRVKSQGRYEVYDLGYDTVPLPFSDSFWMLDAALSYRLPARWGQIVIGGMNLTDHRGFQYLELDAQNRRFAPERYLYGKLLLNF